MLKRLGTLAGAALLTISSAAHAGPASAIYTDKWESGWGSWSWGVTTSEATERPFKGSRSLKVTYGAAWSGFSPGTPENFSTAGYKHLSLALYNLQNGDDLRLYVGYGASQQGVSVPLAGYTDTGSIPQGKWSWVRIPVSDLGFGSSPTISYVAVQSAKANATVYFDEMFFNTNIKLYEGVQSVRGPSVKSNSWTSTVAQLSTGTAPNQDYYLSLTPASNTWGGVSLFAPSQADGIRSEDLGALSISFRKTSTPQAVHVGLYNNSLQAVGRSVDLTEARLPRLLRPMSASNWYRVIIPLKEFGVASSQIGGVYIQAFSNTTMYIDDVVLLRKLNWPLAGVYPGSSAVKGGFHFGDDWSSYATRCTTSKPILHAATDFHAPEGTSVHSTGRGIVRYAGPVQGWGTSIVIEHERGFTTTYHHLSADLKPSDVGKEIGQGSFLGKTVWLPSGAHMHLGIRLAPYDDYSIRGALPLKSGCDTVFPGSFLDPEGMDWASGP